MRHNQRHKNLRRKKKIYKKNITVVIFLKNPQNQINNKKKNQTQKLRQTASRKRKREREKEREKKKNMSGEIHKYIYGSFT